MEKEVTVSQNVLQFRHYLHEHPELSRQERETAASVATEIAKFSPAQVHTGIGGYGVMAEFHGQRPGPSTLFRAELDALPLKENAHKGRVRSLVEGKAHLCGHDAHMTILLAVAEEISQRKIAKGKVLLLFQPAEETGEGAALVLKERLWDRLSPDLVFALHNIPGEKENSIILKDEIFAFGSVGMDITFTGKTSHAAHPEEAINPTGAVQQFLSTAQRISGEFDTSTFATICHVQIGEKAFGITPGEARILLTLRSDDQTQLNHLVEKIHNSAEETALKFSLVMSASTKEVFTPVYNSPAANKIVKTAAEELNLTVIEKEEPFRWSEDFGRFTEAFPGALFGLGIGEKMPPLHHPDYYFPDFGITTGRDIFVEIIDFIHGF